MSLCQVLLQVVQAQNLAIKDSMTQSSDPYCKIKCDGYSFKTPCIKKSLDPVWEADFNLTVRSDVAVTITCWDKDALKKDDFLGYVKLEIADFVNAGVRDIWIDLSPRPGKHDRVSGQIRLVVDVRQEGAPNPSAPHVEMHNNNNNMDMNVAPVNYNEPVNNNMNYNYNEHVNYTVPGVAPIPESYHPCATVDPLGYQYYGVPITPVPAYEGQYMPPQYVFQPQVQFYQEDYRPPAFFYGPQPTYNPPAYQPPPVQYNTTIIETVEFVDYAPTREIDLDLNSGSLRTTDVADRLPHEIDIFFVSHINMFNNSLKRIEGLWKFPNLMRITLRHNDLKNIEGIGEAPYLRWIDISSNKLKNFKGANELPSLEWLDAHYNDMKNLKGLHFAPNLTWLNVYNNDLTSFEGCEYFTSLRWIDASTNDLKTTRGLERCRNLQTIDVSNNDLRDVRAIMDLAELPYLSTLDIFWNDFSDGEISQIKSHFARVKPSCLVITTKKQHKAWKSSDCNWV
eukprot:TRINITY_DN1138_c0_g1_i1.p1 TRINITY_DN1138_c0_g1~~TRINITY_DN1138_c0_g1_i1.p1  ORF type:complete len:520 (-),score=113.08 TRINITY_DN1138_c0_g1_i1:53-1579(-)